MLKNRVFFNVKRLKNIINIKIRGSKPGLQAGSKSACGFKRLELLILFATAFS